MVDRKHSLTPQAALDRTSAHRQPGIGSTWVSAKVILPYSPSPLRSLSASYVDLKWNCFLWESVCRVWENRLETVLKGIESCDHTFSFREFNDKGLAVEYPMKQMYSCKIRPRLAASSLTLNSYLLTLR